MAVNPKVVAVNPKEWRAFKLWVSLTPLPNVGIDDLPRINTYREMGRLAKKAYDALSVHPLVKLPEPPSSATTSQGSLVSGIQGSFAYTPQIGNNEPYIYVMGHFHSNRDIKNPFANRPVFSHGTLFNVPQGHPTLGNPKAEVLDDVKDLKGIIDAEMTAALPANVDYKIDKIDYIGLIFGVGGLHFPQ